MDLIAPDAVESLFALLRETKAARPSDWYQASDMQRAFHKATHAIRFMCPGNGAGKTTAMGIEANWWVRHKHPWQVIPDWPIVAIWVAPQFRQFDILRPQIESECLDAGWHYNGSDNFYEWGDGAKLYVVPSDRDWTYLQGINPDIVLFDEEPPLKLWREMLQRRRGKRKTRFVIGATATAGVSWMEPELYQPWKDHHRALGLDADRALIAQQHPHIWCWDRGGIRDNPGASVEDVAWYESRTWSNEKERKVRLRGGFENWTGDAVFDQSGVDWLRTRVASGELGWLELEAPKAR